MQRAATREVPGHAELQKLGLEREGLEGRAGAKGGWSKVGAWEKRAAAQLLCWWSEGSASGMPRFGKSWMHECWQGEPKGRGRGSLLFFHSCRVC